MKYLEVKVNEQKTFYELEKDRHSHIFSKNCSSLNDIVISTNSLEQEVSYNNSFNVVATDITYYGLCTRFQQNNIKSNIEKFRIKTK